MEGVLYKWTNYLSGERRAGRAGAAPLSAARAASRALAGVGLTARLRGSRGPGVFPRAVLSQDDDRVALLHGSGPPLALDESFPESYRSLKFGVT